jgi:hypothetical protein
VNRRQRALRAAVRGNHHAVRWMRNAMGWRKAILQIGEVKYTIACIAFEPSDKMPKAPPLPKCVGKFTIDLKPFKGSVDAMVRAVGGVP